MTKKHDESAHMVLLQKGTYSLNRENNIHINTIESYSQGSGFGTAVMREVIKEAMEQNRTVTLDAAYTSHIFHLYMGMVPIDTEILYVSAQYGISGEQSIKNLTQDDTVEDLNETDELQDLLMILKVEKKLPEHSVLTAQDVIDNKEFLMGLSQKMVSFLTFQFIPHLLRILEAGIADKYPNTSGLTIFRMELSRQGKERWQEAIHQGIEFSPFKGFEQLIPFMTDTQKERLDAIFKQRPQAQAVAAIEVNFSNEKTKDAVEAHKAQLLGQLDSYGSNNDLIQRVITIKKRIIETDVKKQKKVIDDAAAHRNAEEQCPQQIEEQRVDELEQPHLQ